MLLKEDVSEAWKQDMKEVISSGKSTSTSSFYFSFSTYHMNTLRKKYIKQCLPSTITLEELFNFTFFFFTVNMKCSKSSGLSFLSILFVVYFYFCAFFALKTSLGYLISLFSYLPSYLLTSLFNYFLVYLLIHLLAIFHSVFTYFMFTFFRSFFPCSLSNLLTYVPTYLLSCFQKFNFGMTTF